MKILLFLGTVLLIISFALGFIMGFGGALENNE